MRATLASGDALRPGATDGTHAASERRGGTADAAPTPGGWIENAEGRCFVARRAYPLGHVHGLDPLGGFFGVSPEHLSRLCNEPALAGMDLSSALFLDTETTGLDRGATTLVFMLGVGYFHGDRFHVLQFFIEGVSQERAMLHAVRELLRESGFLVTFNGKHFDGPMIDSRYEHQRWEPPVGALPQADLLYTSRRLWKERLQNVRLQNVEREILHLRRRGDVPSRLVPQLYAEYLADRDPQALARIIDHNVIDILTLVSLATHASAVYAEPFGGRVETGADYLSLGKTYELTGEEELAMKAYDRGLALPVHPAFREELCRRISPLYKRHAQHPRAVELWEGMVGSGEARGIYPYEELAKFYEHTEQRYDRAEEMVLRAIALLPHDRCTRTTTRDLEKRLRRIRAKRGEGQG